MALINCPECNNEVSDKAEICPKCGIPIAEKNLPISKTMSNKKTSSSSRKIIYKTFGLLFIFIGIGGSNENPIMGIFFVFMGVFFISRGFKPSKKEKYNSQPEKGSLIKKTLYVMFFMFIFTVAITSFSNYINLAEEKKLTQENIEYFEQNSAEILREVSQHIENERFLRAIEISGKYLPANNESLSLLHRQATQAQSDFEKIEEEKRIASRTEEILEQLKTIPSSNYKENLKLYQELVRYHPNNERYVSRLNHYTERLNHYTERLNHYTERLNEYNRKIREEELAKAIKDNLERKWVYFSSIDQMTSKEIKSASINSENFVNFSFPYNGNQRGKITIRNHPRHGNEVIFLIEKGQILCRNYEDCNIVVRFGDSPPVQWKAIGPSDSTTTVIFLRNQAEFRRRMQSSKEVRIQIPVFQEGNRIFTFEPSGFSNERLIR